MNPVILKIIACLSTVTLMIIIANTTNRDGSLVSIVISFLIIFLTSLGLISTPRWKATRFAHVGWGMFIGSMIILALGIILFVNIIRMAPLAS